MRSMACRPGILRNVHGHICRILIPFILDPEPSADRHTSNSNVSLSKSVFFALAVVGRSFLLSDLLPPLLPSCHRPGP
jgi:hypothetical protein